jgi:hypothetical protein
LLEFLDDFFAMSALQFSSLEEFQFKPGRVPTGIP